jgi:protein-disulfide isomerase
VAVLRNRLLLLAAAAAVALVAVVAVVIVGTSGGSGTTSTAASSTAATTGSSTAPESQSMFAGVPQHGDTLGRATAPATLTVYEDPQCPYCRQWNIDTLPTVVRDYVRTGRVKIVYRGIVVIGGNSVAGIRVAYAAGRQNKLWNMVEALYERQGTENSGWITIPVIRQAAAEVHVGAARILKDGDSKAVTDEFKASETEAAKYGVNGTPTFAIQKPLGSLQQLHVPGLTPDQFTPALDAALQ